MIVIEEYRDVNLAEFIDQSWYVWNCFIFVAEVHFLVVDAPVAQITAAILVQALLEAVEASFRIYVVVEGVLAS